MVLLGALQDAFKVCKENNSNNNDIMGPSTNHCSLFTSLVLHVFLVSILCPKACSTEPSSKVVQHCPAGLLTTNQSSTLACWQRELAATCWTLWTWSPACRRRVLRSWWSKTSNLHDIAWLSALSLMGTSSQTTQKS